VKQLLKKKMIVHNVHLIDYVLGNLGFKPMVVRDGISGNSLSANSQTAILSRLGLTPENYVLVPCSFSSDEPLQEIIEAARLLSDITFVMTWYSERLPHLTRNSLPANILLTGYLDIDSFNCVFGNAGVVIVLTKQENIQLSGMQEAMMFEIPAVVTDLKTTRFLYREAPVYVQNGPESIADGVKYAFQHRNQLRTLMRGLRTETQEEFFTQLKDLKVVLESVH
jgi:glycosyltransferase involved in cell wall biosynthesis